ncbi:unnamed protein product [Mesocestoides corti]|uniref:non-specific serine/threonine protein kinase n=1 Tax=Mesocestoides corti TaxID=53468 RepID=A0A0R3U729_MESCO|nr:unnamed protein product [Mesocestoides corti]
MPILIPKALQGLYFLCEPIADGSFGKLYLAIHALTRQQVAIKIIDKRKLGGEAFRVRGEIEALKRLSHPNIYSLYHVIETDTTFYLILEYVPGGELFDYILHHGSLREPHARLLFRQLVSAVGYSHSKGIAHRDLKPNSDNTYLDTYCGSLAYAAPEVIANREYSGPAADIWSMGVILYAILCGCLPFDPSRPEKLPKLIAHFILVQKGQYVIDESLSKSSRCLISKMLCVDPEERITMSELCKHPWVMEDWGSPIDLLVDNKQVIFLK